MIKASLLVLSAICFISACSNSRPEEKAGMVESFTTNISKNGTKYFVYSVSRSQKSNDAMSGEGRGGGRGAGEGKGGRGSGSRNKGSTDDGDRSNMLFRQTINKLNLKLAETGYCKEGFIELDRNINKNFISVRGECNDGATDGDRDRFKNV